MSPEFPYLITYLHISRVQNGQGTQIRERWKAFAMFVLSICRLTEIDRSFSHVSITARRQWTKYAEFSLSKWLDRHDNEEEEEEEEENGCSYEL